MKRISEHAMAIEVSKREGGKLNLPIAQVKEVMRHTLDVLQEKERFGFESLSEFLWRRFLRQCRQRARKRGKK